MVFAAILIYIEGKYCLKNYECHVLFLVILPSDDFAESRESSTVLSFIHLHFVLHYLIFIMGAHWAVPVHSLQFLSTIHSFMIVGVTKGKFPEWPFVFLMQISSWKDTRKRITSLSLLCATVAANKTKPSSICFCWESFNNRWVLNTSPMNINSACSVLRKDLIICVCWLSCNFLLSSQSFANHVAINILRRWDKSPKVYL